MSKEKFYKFAKEINLNETTIDKLWEGNISSPQVLAVSSEEDVLKITNDVVLCKVILPALQKHAKQIALAKDPYQQAIYLLRKDVSYSEPDTAHHSSVKSDAMGFYEQTSRSNKPGLSPCHVPSVQMSNDLTSNSILPQFGKIPKGYSSAPGKSTVINIGGGSFTGSNIGCNIKTITKTSVVSVGDGKDGQISKQIEATAMKIKGVCFSTSDLQFCDNKEFLLSDASVLPSDDAVYRSRLNDSKYYPIYTRKSNRAIIINNVDFSRKVMTRYGADKDEKKMEFILKKLGFDVTTFTNKRIPEIKQCLHEFASSPENDDTSATVVFIGSHGEEKDKHNYFVGTNGESMKVSEVCQYFSAEQCPSLVRKPKIFFFQCCRKARQTKVQADSVEEDAPVNMDFLPSIQSDATSEVHEAHSMADMLVSFATAPGTKAYRDTNEGSWFVTALCKVLAEDAAEEDLLSMMSIVNSAVMAKEANLGKEIAVQMAELKSTLTKKVRFYPRKV